MSSTMILTIFFTILGALFSFKKVPPNFVIGIRTKSTIQSKIYWYALHHVFGSICLIIGVVNMAVFVLFPSTLHQPYARLIFPILIQVIVPLIVSIIFVKK